MSESQNINVEVSETAENSAAATTAAADVAPQETRITDRNVAVPLSLLVRSCNMIDALSKRGCFRANEMADVGGLYNSLLTVVNAAINQLRAEQTLTGESGDAAADSSTDTSASASVSSNDAGETQLLPQM